MSKFPNSAKMKAKYDVYLKKSHLIIQTIKNSLQDNELMLELMTGQAQNYEFVANKRKSLVIQQNAGYRNYFT